jgi:putative protease
VRLDGEILPGDRLKVVSRHGDGRRNAFTVKTVQAVAPGKNKQLGEAGEIFLEVPVACRRGDVLVKVGSKDPYSSRGAKYWLEKLKREIEPPGRKGRKVVRYDAARLAAFFPSVAESFPNLRPWQLKVASWEHMQRFSRERGCDLVVELNRQVVHRLVGRERRVYQQHPHLVWSLPAINFPGSEQKLAGEVKRLLKAGFRRFQLNNLGQVLLFDRSGEQGLELYTGAQLPATNPAAVAACRSLGFSAVFLSPEMDRESIEAVCRQAPEAMKLILLVFAFLPLLPTRMPLPLSRKKSPLTSPRGEQLFPCFRDGLTCLVSGRPFSLADRFSQLPGADVVVRCIDFSFYPPGFNPASQLAKIRRGKTVLPSTSFNYGRKWD